MSSTWSDGEHDALGVAEGDVAIRLELVGEFLGVTSSVIGIGQSVPSASRILLQTDS